MRSLLDRIFERSFGTIYPEDEQIRDLYRFTQIQMYPSKDGGAPERDKRAREKVKEVRRALEASHGWLRQDPEIREAERTTKPASEMDILITPQASGPVRGVVVLKRAKPNGNNEILPWERRLPEAEERGEATTSKKLISMLIESGAPPLNVLLGHIWHFRRVVDGETTVRLYQLMESRGGGPIPVPLGSAMSLSDFMAGLRNVPT